jgi:transcriptional regulator with XRE-family HTH domain
MVTLDERMTRLSPSRRAKIEARTDELHRDYVVLRQLREKLNLSQSEMAARVGVKQPALSKLETGQRRVTLEKLTQVIAALGGEWELIVRLPDTSPMRVMGSEDFCEAGDSTPWLSEEAAAQTGKAPVSTAALPKAKRQPSRKR